MRNRGVRIRQEMAKGSVTLGVVFHVKSNGSSSLGSTTDMIELDRALIIKCLIQINLNNSTSPQMEVSY